jgi:DNA-binding NarL/FixJ family response regulator
MNSSHTVGNEPEFTHHQSFLSELTCREWAILLHLSDDLLNAEIADRLKLSKKSVVNYRNRMGQKLFLSGAHNLARFARKHKVALHIWYERRWVPCRK